MTDIILSSSSSMLSLAEQRRGLHILLSNSFLMLFGFFTFVTVFALNFTHNLGFTAASVGLALALRQMTQQGLDIFGGAFADRVGYRFSITLGCLIRVGGFVGIGFARSLPQLVISCVVMGFGGMFFDAAGSAALASIVPEAHRSRTFAIQATLNNVGAALGPIVSIVLYSTFGYLAVALVAAGVFFWIAIQTWLWLPAHIGEQGGKAQEPCMPLPQVMRAIMERRGFVRVVLLTMGFWVIVSQITLTVPLQTERLFGERNVGVIIGLNSFLAIPLQYPLVRFVARRMHPLRMLSLSFLLSGVGLTILFLAPTFTWQIVGIVITTVGSLPVGPTIQSITAEVAPPRAFAAFYGFSAIGVGVGGAAGQYLGGRLYDAQTAMHTTWLMGIAMFVVAVGIAIAMEHAPSPTALTHAREVIVADEEIAERSGIIPIPLG